MNRGLFLLAIALLLIPATGVLAQNQTAGEGNQTASNDGGGLSQELQDRNLTFGQFGTEVTTIITDDLLYGFSEPSDNRKRMGDIFKVYIIPHDGPIQYQIIVDGVPMPLGNGNNTRVVEEVTVEEFNFNGTNRIEFQVKVVTANGPETRDYGTFRLRSIERVKEEAAKEDEDLEEDIVDQIKDDLYRFTQREFLGNSLKFFTVLTYFIGASIWAGWLWVRDQIETQGVELYGN